MTANLLSAILAVISVGLTVAAAMLFIRLRGLQSRYKPIRDVEAEGRRLKDEATRHAEQTTATAARELERLRGEVDQQRKLRDALLAEGTAAAATHKRLKNEVALLEENLEDISFGIYKPHFDYDTPENYKAALEDAVTKQREMVKAGSATHFAVEWSVRGSRQEGERMQRQYSKLLLRAFNGECEAAIAKVAWNNAAKMEERIRKAFAAINALGGVMQVSIVESYMNLKLAELQLEHEFEEKKRAVLEEQRRVRDQMREQEKAQRELDAARADAEEEEARFAKALEEARVDAAKAGGEEHARLTARILELEEELSGARQKRERVGALAELTKAGYVYFLSNIGSFGDGTFKIGMTRRLDPADRVKELSDASVPFGFDVHAMVYSEDAPALESAFHQQFADRSINPMNPRKEFFRVSIDELQAFANARGLKIAFTRLPEAREYREVMAARVKAEGTHPVGGASNPGPNQPMQPTGSAGG
jgi:hypothetical protein